jgi:hypothetical protein
MNPSDNLILAWPEKLEEDDEPVKLTDLSSKIGGKPVR